MKKKLLSLALALAFCLGLAVPVSAAGTQRVVVDETHGVKVTMDGFLRVETRRYNLNVGDDMDMDPDKPQGWTVDLTIYVVADNSTVTVEAMEGRKYADPSFVECFKDIGSASMTWWGMDTPEMAVYRTFTNNMESYAYNSRDGWGWDNERSCFYSDSFYPWPLEKAVTMTVSPADDSEYGYIYVNEGYGIGWLCESDYARLIPATLQASDWAQEEVEKAWNAGIMPFSPYLVNCAKGMTRAQFAATALYLYAAMIGEDYWNLDVDAEHPFTDADWNTTSYYSEIGMAYNLGFVKGSNTAGTLFNPQGALTRQEAAVMLGRVYAKLFGDVPAVSNTSFGDDQDVADWAKSEVALMSGKEIVKGVGGNRFAPTGTLTIQEAVVMANRMLENLK